MNRDQIIKNCKHGRELSQQPGFAQTPINPRHAKRLRELQLRRVCEGAFHNMEMKPGVFAIGSLVKPDEYARTSPDRRKTVKGEDGCMPGKGGKCVLCGTGDCLRRPE